MSEQAATYELGEYELSVGLDSVYIAEVTQDDLTGYLAGTPEYLAPVGEVTAEPAVESKTDYYDNKAFSVAVAEGETTLKLTLSNVPLGMQAKITGKKFDAATGRMIDQGGTPPYYALGFRSLKSNGSYRYFWYAKGRFAPPSEAFATKTNSPDSKPMEVTFTALKTTCELFEMPDGGVDGVKRIVGDDDIEVFSGTAWFDEVQVPDISASV